MLPRQVGCYAPKYIFQPFYKLGFEQTQPRPFQKYTWNIRYYRIDSLYKKTIDQSEDSSPTSSPLSSLKYNQNKFDGSINNVWICMIFEEIRLFFL